MQNMDLQLCCYANQMMREYNYYYQFQNNQMENNCYKTIDKSFDIQLLEQTHFTSQACKKNRVGH